MRRRRPRRRAIRGTGSDGVAPSRSAAPSRAPADRMTFAGHVVDWYSKPVVGAAVDLVGRPRRRLPDGTVVIGRAVLLGRGTSGAQGRFRIEAARTSRSTFIGVHALALAPGFGPGWTDFEPDSERPAAEIRLRPEQVLRGQLVDLAGRPAAGVEIQVDNMSIPGRFSVDLTSMEDALLKASWPGRGRSRPTTRAGRRSPASAGGSVSTSSAGSALCAPVARARRPRRAQGDHPGPPAGPSRASSSPPTPASPSRAPCSSRGEPRRCHGDHLEPGPGRWPGSILRRSLPGRPLRRECLSSRWPALPVREAGVRPGARGRSRRRSTSSSRAAS